VCYQSEYWGGFYQSEFTSQSIGVIFYQAEYWSNITSLNSEMCVSSPRALHNR